VSRSKSAMMPTSRAKRENHNEISSFSSDALLICICAHKCLRGG
jgi:hypothetical protein